MQNYLSKQNLGIPAGLACILAYMLGYGVTRTISCLWVLILFTAFVFMFSFEEKIRGAVKKGMILAAAYYVIQMVLYILNQIVAWFGSSSSVEDAWESVLNGSSSGTSGVSKFIMIVGNVAEFAIFIAFIFLIISAFLNKEGKFKVLDKAASDTVVCPQCGAKLGSDAAFCTKCGTKVK